MCVCTAVSASAPRLHIYIGVFTPLKHRQGVQRGPSLKVKSWRSTLSLSPLKVSCAHSKHKSRNANRTVACIASSRVCTCCTVSARIYICICTRLHASAYLRGSQMHASAYLRGSQSRFCDRFPVIRHYRPLSQLSHCRNCHTVALSHCRVTV